MKKTLRGITLTAFLLSASTTTLYGDEFSFVGDDAAASAFVGDSPSLGEDAYFADDAREAEIAQVAHRSVVKAASAKKKSASTKPATAKKQAAVRPVAQVATRPVAQAAPQMAVGQPYNYAQMQFPAQHAYPAMPQMAYGAGVMPVNHCSSPGCSTMGCDGGCSSMPMPCDGGCAAGGCDSMGGCGSTDGGCGLASGLGLCSGDGWFRHEALLWYVQGRDMIPLVAGNVPGVAAELDVANTTVLFGNQIEDDFSLGYRGDVGMYVTDNVGIGGRFWIIDDNGDSYSSFSDGSAFTLGIPFYDDLANQENSLVIGSLGIPTVGDRSGNVSVTSEVSMLGAEAYTRMNLSCSKSCQLDFIGGFSHFQVDDSLNLLANIDDGQSIFSFNDRFETENSFIGGQVGFEAVINRGGWTARSLTKVHLGNMAQTVMIAGSTSQDFQTAPPTINTVAGGIFADGNALGTYERDEFSFVPELNFKLGYRFTEHVEMSVGYSFLYFANTALVGDVIDRTVNPLGINNDAAPLPTRPTFEFADSSLWLQGVDIGFAVIY